MMIEDVQPFYQGLPFRCGAVLLSLWGRADTGDRSPVVYVSRETIARYIGGAHDRTIRRALNELEDAGAIERLPDGGIRLHRWDHESGGRQ